MEFKTIPINMISPNPFQPRVSFERKSLQELANSIKKRGVLEPIIVRKLENTYQIIAGERRWRAAKMAGFKEILAIVGTIPEEDILIESLMENIHRTDLTDTERENAIYEVWMTGRFKTRSEMANALGLKKQSISEDIDAWEFRQRNETGKSVPTYIIARTNGLDEEERKKIIKKFEKDELGAVEVYSVVKTARKASSLLKRELLKSESSVTPRIAEAIVENLPNHSDQNIAIQAVKKYRLNVNEVVNLVSRIQQEKEVDEKTVEIVSEVDTGYLFKCPVCKHTYKIFHNKPTSRHSFREMP